jgi:serine/threonine protein kinase
VQKELSHPNIVRIYEAIWTQDQLFIFMELARGRELFDRLLKEGRLLEEHAVKVFHQVLMAVAYMHGLGIVHRDIKTENIIVDDNFNTKLVDFGLSKKFTASPERFLTTLCGSPSYIAPEILDKRKYNGVSIDIWCLGITLYVLLEACLPFDTLDEAKRNRNIN